MARKANRQEIIYEDGGKEKSRAASYVRLSKKDKGDSLAYQKALIREYIKGQEDLELVLEFEDNNRTGTNFDRTGFLALIKAIKKQEVDCVVVKDLSRFGRNLQEMCEYLELVFPQMGVRFISVLDGYDSASPDWMKNLFLLQLRCLLYERYAKDISKKIHTSVELMQNRGELVGSVPYGYRRTEGKVEVTEAAESVQLIYRLAQTGMGNRAIALELDRLGYTTPLEYKRTGILRQNFGLASGWQSSSVGRILENGAVIINIKNRHLDKICLHKNREKPKKERNGFYGKGQQKSRDAKEKGTGESAETSLSYSSLYSSVSRGKSFCGTDRITCNAALYAGAICGNAAGYAAL